MLQQARRVKPYVVRAQCRSRREGRLPDRPPRGRLPAAPGGEAFQAPAACFTRPPIAVRPSPPCLVFPLSLQHPGAA